MKKLFLISLLLLFFAGITTRLASPIHAQNTGDPCIDVCGQISDPTKNQDCLTQLGCFGPVTGGGGGGGAASGKLNIAAPENLPPGVQNIEGIITNIVQAAILIAAILAFIYLIWGGIQWITSGGDKAALESARSRITNAIVGLVIVAAAWAIFTLVQNVLLGDTILNLAE